MVLEPVDCPNCDGINVIKHGMSAAGKQRYRGQRLECDRGTQKIEAFGERSTELTPKSQPSRGSI